MTEHRPALRDRKRRQAREKIVEAAFALFAERGFAEVTVTEIAERAEVGRTTFFRYFGDKQDLLDQLVARERDLPAPTPQTLIEALVQLRETVAALCEESARDQRRYVTHERLLAQNPELHDRNTRKLQCFTEVMEEVLISRGTCRDIAVLAPQVALGCFHAGRRLAGLEAGALADEVRAAFDRVTGAR